ncbi:hypothetical protein SEA_ONEIAGILLIAN_54 [Microbacterium phage OneinaGillian]|uniref:Uncharacterized protein n=1 Tax=Microbacterium phage OneinaGillian TaxID=2301604 RepID=A0A385UJC2_9CAUD|nr:hypothetical protein HOU23_gp054 [Microbacterium phage OneinaGillian]AYB70164.1 hypothetical protein SEA_ONEIAGILLIAN_54 [Microbacterium phage OneinaGillian]QJD53277.1 hypothetical protein SEA_TEMPO_54 [Microbacterium phage Tempo]WNN94081.1 hypothetical protein SEA_FREGLEY_55 [Microbacterium phage Fregley]WNT44265.1 hypothetical protein SEA_CANDC_53 [Microbacterium phage CandC]
MAEFRALELQTATQREKAALQRLHPRLGSKVVKVGRWPFRRREWKVVCPDCEWESDRTIPIVPLEMKSVENMLLVHAMEEHLIESLRTLTLRQKWRGRG